MAQFLEQNGPKKFITRVSEGDHGQITVAGRISESTSSEREHKRPWAAQEALESSWNTCRLCGFYRKEQYEHGRSDWSITRQPGSAKLVVEVTFCALVSGLG